MLGGHGAECGARTYERDAVAQSSKDLFQRPPTDAGLVNRNLPDTFLTTQAPGGRGGSSRCDKPASKSEGGELRGGLLCSLQIDSNTSIPRTNLETAG